MRWAILLLTLFSPGSTGEPCGDRARFQGTWRVVAMQEDGEPIHDAGGELDDDEFFRALDFRFTFDGDRLVQTGNFQGFGEPGGRDTIVTYTIDPQASPKALDIEHVRGRSFSVQRAIYEFRGGRLRIGFGGGERPKAFDAGPGSGPLVYELERVRPPDRHADRDGGRGP
jgi:uncharacterized protein (TIGR03067 family)